MIYFFELGRSPALALAELKAFFPSQLFRKGNDHIYTAEFSSELNVAGLMQYAGGIVSYGQVLPHRFEGEEGLAADISIILKENTKSIALSNLSGQEISIPSVLDAIKKQSQLKNVSLRYVLPQPGMNFMRSATLYHELNKGRFEHFIIWVDENGYRVGRTIEVQDIEAWSAMDFGKPSRRIEAGLLPPKVARMMLNIALGNVPNRSTAPTLYDPFCGSGTTLLEGLRVGLPVIGSDISEEAVRSAQQNVDWFISHYPIEHRQHPFFGYPFIVQRSARVFTCDAVHLGKEELCDIVVTEPYMGPLFTDIPPMEVAKNHAKGLLKLYLGFFKSLKQVLRPGGVVVFSLPFYRFKRDVLRIPLIDRLQLIGYNPIIPSCDYFVEQTIVGREITVLRLEK